MLRISHWNYKVNDNAKQANLKEGYRVYVAMDTVPAVQSNGLGCLVEAVK